MSWKNELYEIKFDRRKYQSRLGDYLEETTKAAARSWLRAVLMIVPTWSKASRATFEALASSVGYQVTYGPLTANVDRTSLGLSTGDGGLMVKRSEGTYYFYYKTSLRYLIYNEMNRATPGPPPRPFGQLLNPTPYKFRDAGAADFHSFASNYVKLPLLSPYTSGKRI